MLIRKNYCFYHPCQSGGQKIYPAAKVFGYHFKEKSPWTAIPEDKLTILITRIIDANNDSNFRHLRVIEERGDDLNEDLMNSQTDRYKLGPENI